MSHALTRGHIARAAMEHNWQVLTSNPEGIYFRRGPIGVNLGFNSRGALVKAIKYGQGEAVVPTKGRLAYVMSWLTEPPVPAVEAI